MERDQVAAGGVRFAVRRDGGAPPELVVLCAEHQPAPVQPGLACLEVELPGWGGSERCGGLDATAEAVAALVAHESSEPVHLLGHGLAGAVALRLAATRPELLRSLVVLAAPLPGGPGSRRYAAALAARGQPGYARSLLAPLDVPAGPARVLLIWGAADRLLPEPVGHGLHRRLAAVRAPAAVRMSVLAGAGHDLHRSAVEPVWTRVREFLGSSR